jgi:hypothetical protein
MRLLCVTPHRTDADALSASQLNSGVNNLATPRQSVRHEIVTHVLGTFCYLCLRAGHLSDGAARGIRTPDPVITKYGTRCIQG